LLAVLLANIVDGANVWMIERGGSFGFAAEALERGGTLRSFRRKKLERGCGNARSSGRSWEKATFVTVILGWGERTGQHHAMEDAPRKVGGLCAMLSQV